MFLHIHGISSRKIALEFGRTQIQSIAIRKSNVLEDYYNNISGEIKQRRRTTGNDEIYRLFAFTVNLS